MNSTLKDVLPNLEYFKHCTGGIENIIQGKVWQDIIANEEREALKSSVDTIL